jgi:hypothetical protein
LKREDAIDPVNAHDGNEAGIVNLDTLDAVVADYLFPNRVNRRDVRQQSQQALDAADLL